MVLLNSGVKGVLPSLGHPILRNITHLYLNDLRMDVAEARDALPLQTLTHLACGYEYGDHDDIDYFCSRIKQILESPMTRVFLILLPVASGRSPEYVLAGPGLTWMALFKIEDERLFVRVTDGYLGDMYLAMLPNSASGTIWDDVEIMDKSWRTLEMMWDEEEGEEGDGDIEMMDLD